MRNPSEKGVAPDAAPAGVPTKVEGARIQDAPGAIKVMKHSGNEPVNLETVDATPRGKLPAPAGEISAQPLPGAPAVAVRQAASVKPDIDTRPWVRD